MNATLAAPRPATCYRITARAWHAPAMFRTPTYFGDRLVIEKKASGMSLTKTGEVAYA